MSAIANELSAIANEPLGTANELSVIADDPLAIANELSAIADETLAIANELLAITNELSAIANETLVIADETDACTDRLCLQLNGALLHFVAPNAFWAAGDCCPVMKGLTRRLFTRVVLLRGGGGDRRL
ncbi:MAG: hypothetical protein LBK73_15265 [Treponema sp.]|nr:hypothetical protein [Treponema sp.]